MDRFNGLETYLAIPRTAPDLKVIIVSGLSGTRRIEKALAAGVRQYVTKPFSLKTIGLALYQELNTVIPS